MTKIFNWCLCNGYFPKIFKDARVIPILKPGKNPKSPASYRPISMLSVMDKLFEKVVQARLTSFCDRNNVIHKHQFGFKKGHSTIHQIKRIEKMISHNMVNRKSTGVVLLDVEKAFDSVWHNGLLYKLHKFNLPIYLEKIIKSFLTDRVFSVCVDKKNSTLRDIPAGVPQGSILSPTLYSLFTSDFKSLKNQSVAFYADDSAMITR